MNRENWNLLSINECADVIGGGTPSTKNSDYWDGNIPWISPKDLSNNKDKYITNGKRFITELGLEKSSAKLLPANSLLLSSRAPIGYLAINAKPVATNQGFKSLILKDEFDVEFFYYLFKQKTEFIKSFASGSTFQEVSGSVVKNLSFLIPPKQEQEKISNILSKLDKKIELNQQMNETLEEIAKTLFKYWFIEFDPVRAKAEGRPTGLSKEISDLFPDSFEDSELGKIPKGWEVKPLDEIADFLNGLSLQKYPESEEHPKYPVLKIAQLREGSTNDQDVFSSGIPDDYIIRNGDYIFSWSASLLSKFWMGGDAALNQHLFKVTSKDYPDWFYAGWVEKHLDNFSSIASSVATSMGHIKRSDLKDAKTITPSIQTISKLSEYFSNLRKKANLCLLENTVLSDLRDTLLPKLISGELQIKDVENLLEEAGI